MNNQGPSCRENDVWSLSLGELKKCISILLIVLLSAQCLYQLGLISFFQLNRDYIARVLCINKEEPITTCQGQCFLDNNLDPDEGTNTDARTSDNRTKTEVPVFLVVEPGTGTDMPEYHTRGNTPAADLYTFLFQSSVFHPPAA